MVLRVMDPSNPEFSIPLPLNSQSQNRRKKCRITRRDKCRKIRLQEVKKLKKDLNLHRIC